MRKTGRIDMVATAIDPIHHGGGTAGNTQLLRLQDVIERDGTRTRVPFISGNSMKHMIRDGATRFALDAMGVKDGSMTKSVIDLLFSGGHLSKGGSSVDLAKARKLGQLFPVLSLCGYAAGNAMTESKIRPNHLYLVCKENDWRVPKGVNQAFVGLPAGHFISEEFGTRHEALRSPHASKLLEHVEAADRDASISAKKNKKAAPKERGSSQMIYEFEVVCAGSEFWGGFWFTDLTEAELVAFQSGLSYACSGTTADGRYIFSVGGKVNVGFGRIAVEFDSEFRNIVTAPTGTSTNDLTPVPIDKPRGDKLTAYAEQLRADRDEILDILHGSA